MASVSCETRVGIASAAASVAWAGGGGSRSVVDWLPKFDQPIGVIRGDKIYPTKAYWNYLRELGDRVGGIQGMSITQVTQVVTETQAQVAATTSYAAEVADYATQVAATATATAQVAASNSLSGSGSIPSTGSPPSRPNYQVQ